MVQFRSSVFYVASSAFYRLDGELAPQPVAFYAAAFFLVNATYICVIRELIDRIPTDQVSLTCAQDHARPINHDFVFFRVASVVALKYPLAGLGIRL